MTEAKKDSLVGCEVRLDPKKSGMFYDPENDLTLSFFKDGSDTYTITEKTILDPIKKNVKAGILRVFKKDKDVTEKYGGPAPVGRPKPIISKGLPRMEKISKNDEKLAKILNVYDLNEIRKYVTSIQNYIDLDTLEDLEKQGNNPLSQPRASVLDLIKERKKQVSGIKIEKSEETETVEIV